MNPRVEAYVKASQETIDTLHKAVHDLKPFLKQGKPSEVKMISDSISLFQKQAALEAKQMELVSALWNYSLAKKSILIDLQKVVVAMEKWDQAAKDNIGKGVSAFLDATEPLGPEIAAGIVEIQKKRKEQIESKHNVSPSDEELYAHEQQLSDLHALVGAQYKLYKEDDELAVVLSFAEVSHAATLVYFKKWIYIHESNKLQEKSIGSLDKFIQKYSDRIDVMFAEFDKLAEVEAAAEAEQKAALDKFSTGAKDVCIEGQSYLAAASSSSAIPEPEAKRAEVPVLKFPVVEDSPFSSPSRAPSGSSDDEESSDSSLSPRSSPDGSPKSDAKLTPEKKQPTPLKLSSSSAISAALSPIPPAPLHSASSHDKDLKQQAPSSIVSQVPVASQQQDKGLVSKLGFNKDKSVSSYPVAANSASPTPIITPQRNGLSSVR